MFYVWTFMENSPEAQKQDKLGTFFILNFSLLIDFIWTIYWEGKWENVPTLFHEMTIFFSWCGIILKFCIILIVGVLEFDNIKTALFSFIVKSDKHQSFEQLNEDQ